MTSSARHLKPGQKRWDYSVRRYKSNRDIFLEPGLFSIVVLACGRPELTKQTVLETLKNVELYSGEIELVFIENGNCEENYEFFKSLNLERKVIVRQDNAGINHGLNQGWALSRGEYVMILENDWQTYVHADFLSVAKDIFEEQPLIGMIQLRDPRDPNENHGLGKPLYNPWTCDPSMVRDAGIIMSRQVTGSGHTYLVANHPNGFNNNPICIRKQIYRECGPYPEPIIFSDPRHGESEYQERVSKTKWLTAYIGIPVYCHMGKIQTVAS
jgi:glycosyltransferase involved in cell wall biosynthesis